VSLNGQRKSKGISRGSQVSVPVLTVIKVAKYEDKTEGGVRKENKGDGKKETNWGPLRDCQRAAGRGPPTIKGDGEERQPGSGPKKMKSRKFYKGKIVNKLRDYTALCNHV